MRTLIAFLLLAATTAFAATSQQPNPDRLKTIEPIKATPATTRPILVAPNCAGCVRRPNGGTTTVPQVAGGSPPVVVDRPIKPKASTSTAEPILVAPNCPSSCGPRIGAIAPASTLRLAGGGPTTVKDQPIKPQPHQVAPAPFDVAGGEPPVLSTLAPAGAADPGLDTPRAVEA